MRGEKFVQGVDAKHLPFKDPTKVSRRGVNCGLHGWLSVCVGFEFEAGDLSICDAAWDDPFEVAKICRHVKRKAVRGDALRDMYAYGGDFFFADTAAGNGPDTGELGDALGHNAEVAAGADQYFLKEANVVDRPEMRAFFPRKIAAQIDDGISDELPWTVVRYVAATIDLVQFNSALYKQVIIGENVRAMGVAPKRQHRRVFQQKQRVTDEVLFARCNNLLLDGKRLSKRNTPESKKIDVHC
jgi:hypothetical protein